MNPVELTREDVELTLRTAKANAGKVWIRIDPLKIEALCLAALRGMESQGVTDATEYYSLGNWTKHYPVDCDALSLHPTEHPLGDSHHTDVKFSEEDERIGWTLAYFMGTLFADVDGKNSSYWYYHRTSVDEWARVARALRIHGLQIVDGARAQPRGEKPCYHGWPGCAETGPHEHFAGPSFKP